MPETNAAGDGPDHAARFEVSHRRTGSISLLTVHGELDLAQSPRLWVAVNEALRTAPRFLVIDICGVGFVDSTGLALLLNARRRTGKLGIGLKLACDVERTLNLLRVTRLAREFDVHPDAGSALDACGSDGDGP